MSSIPTDQKMTKEEFFTYFREVEPVEEGNKPQKLIDNVLTIEDYATYDKESWKNLTDIFKNSGALTEQQLSQLNSDRISKGLELNTLSEQETRDLNEEDHIEDLVEEVKEIREKKTCENLTVSDDPDSVLSGLDDLEGEYNVVIIDPAREAFQGYGEKTYTGQGTSRKIYEKFKLLGEKHRLNLQAGGSMINIKAGVFKPKIKALIHAVGPTSRGDFNNFYEYLDKTLKSIFDTIKGLKRDESIDDETEIRLPLISASNDEGQGAVANKAGVYFPRYLDYIRKYFSKKEEDGKEIDKCKLINPLTLYIPEEYYEDYEKYEINLGIEECWVYDFDGVVHNIVTEDNYKKLKELGFDRNWEVLKNNLNEGIIEDMKSGNGLVRLKVISGNPEIFKNSTYELLTNNGVEIDLEDITFGLKKPKDRFLNDDLITRMGIKVVKYVDDFWKNIELIYNSRSAGFLKTLQFLYWYSNATEELYPIELFKPLPDLREDIARQKFSDIIDNDPTKLTFLENCYKLLTIYTRGYSFPEWSIYYVMENFEILNKTLVYFDKRDEPMLNDIAKLVREREPCNIGSQRLYNLEKMKREFGYEIGYYDRYYQKERKLLPNIAIFSETPLRGTLEKNLGDGVKIISSIGYAFDDENQSDYRYFLSDYTEDKKQELLEKYKDVINKIFQCAIDQKCTTIVFSLIGAASFGVKYPGNFIKDIFSVAFNVIKNSYDEVMKTNKFDIKFMGTGKLKDGEITDKFYFTGLGFEGEYTDIGFFPGNVEKVEIRKTLFVNAWDMLTVPGNGNFADKSLDGFMGRFSAIGVLGTGLTNPHILEVGSNYRSVPRPGEEGFASGASDIGIPETPQEAIEDEITKEFVRNARNLRSVYKSGYEFPEWSIMHVVNHKELLEEVKVYYDKKDKDLDVIKKLVYQREPVNMGTNRYYDKDKLQELFGYRTGYYDEYYEKNKKLPPNIAIFTRAGLKRDGEETVTTNINIINSIGYAFDSPEQSDYKYFFKNGRDNINKEELKGNYINIFNKIFKCACDHNCKLIVFCLVGGGFFSDRYPGGRVGFMREIFAPCFNDVKKFYDDKMENNKFDINFMGASDDPTFFKTNFDTDYKDIGYFPDNIDKVRDELNTTLFVNGWDMLSVIGNGNGQDLRSIDGNIGNFTTAGVLGSGLTNRYLRDSEANYIPVPLPTDPSFASNCINIGEVIEEEQPEEVIREKVTERKKICVKFYTITDGIFTGYEENKENNWIIIDPGGEAFLGGNKTYQGGGLSGFIYDEFQIEGKEHNQPTTFSYCDARISEADLTGKARAMIHAIGPDGRIEPYKSNKQEFYRCLDQCINNIGTLLDNEDLKRKIDTDTQIRIPLISSALYGGDIVNINDMTEYFINLTESIKKHICPKGYTIVLGLRGNEEINGFEKFYKFYKKISQQPNPSVNNSSSNSTEPFTDEEHSLEQNMRMIRDFKNLIGIGDAHRDGINTNRSLVDIAKEFPDKKFVSISETTFSKIESTNVTIYPEVEDNFTLLIKLLDSLPVIWYVCNRSTNALSGLEQVLPVYRIAIRRLIDLSIQTYFSECFNNLERLVASDSPTEQEYDSIRRDYQNIITYYNTKQILKRYITEDINPMGYQNSNESYKVHQTGVVTFSNPMQEEKVDIYKTWFALVRNISILDRAGEMIERYRADYFIINMGEYHLCSDIFSFYFGNGKTNRLLLAGTLSNKQGFHDNIGYYINTDQLQDFLSRFIKNLERERQTNQILSSPLKFKRNKKYLSPASKINNSRNKKKNKINKLKIK